MIATLAGSLLGKAGIALAVLLVLGGIYWKITSDAYDRGVAARDKEAREIINRMEARLKEALKKNETLTDDELDCALRRLRQPNAACSR